MSRLTARIAGRSDQLEVAAGEVVAIPEELVAPLTGLGLGWRTRRRHDVQLDGRRLGGRGPAARVRRGLGSVVGNAVAADVSVLDQLAAVATLGAARALLAEAPLLAGRGGEPAGVLSGGERRVLAWLRCQLTHPKAVVLDRAGTGLDAEILAWCGEVVTAWRTAGVAVLIHVGRNEEEAWLVGE